MTGMVSAVRDGIVSIQHDPGVRGRFPGLLSTLPTAGSDAEGSLTQEGIYERFGRELQQVAHFFAYAYEADGEVEFAGDGYGDAAFCGAVELGEDDAGGARGLGELARLLEAVLAGGGVHDEEDFVGRAGDELGGGAAHFIELVHEAGFGVEAAGGVDDELG